MEAPGRSVSAIVLAAGQGTRMRSRRPKPLHRLGGRLMVRYVLDALSGVSPERIIVVVGHGADAVTAQLSGTTGGATVEFVEQTHQRGTGHAVGVGLDVFGSVETDGDASDADVLVLPGDAPLLRPETVLQLVETHRSTDAAATVLTARLDNPSGYGRIMRDEIGGVTGVVEQADATERQQTIDEVNTSMYCFRRDLLASALGQIQPDNAQGEWYLTDVIGVLHDAGQRVTAYVLDDPSEARGVNDRVQLAAAEAALRMRTNESWMRAGVTMVDPVTTYVDTTVQLGEDVTVFPGAMLRGDTVIGAGCQIGPHAQLFDAVVGDGATVGASAVLESGAVVEPGVRVEPLTHLVGDGRTARR